MPVPANYGGQGPSCFDRVKMGFMMGMCVGMASGAIFGGFNCLRFGLRGRELISQVGKVMVQGGGTFGTFMAIGTGIRCWAMLEIYGPLFYDSSISKTRLVWNTVEKWIISYQNCRVAVPHNSNKM